MSKRDCRVEAMVTEETHDGVLRLRQRYGLRNKSQVVELALEKLIREEAVREALEQSDPRRARPLRERSLTVPQSANDCAAFPMTVRGFAR